VRQLQAESVSRQRFALEVARLIQQNFLPKRIPDLPGWRIAAHCRPYSTSRRRTMNSGGIGLLVILLVRAQRQAQRVLGYGLSERYRQTFQPTRLDEAMSVHDDEYQPLAAVNGEQAD
jgi:hypothetical protein